MTLVSYICAIGGVAGGTGSAPSAPPALLTRTSDRWGRRWRSSSTAAPVGDIQGVGGRRWPAALISCERLEAVLAAGGEHDAVTGGGELPGGGGADPAARTGDDGDARVAACAAVMELLLGHTVDFPGQDKRAYRWVVRLSGPRSVACPAVGE